MDSYDFNYTKRGRAVIISNGYFWKGSGFSNRYGAKVDTKRMKKLFTRLGFNVKDYSDKTKGEMIEKLKKVAANEQKKHNDTAKKGDADCFVCVISSHGEQVEEVEERDGMREIRREQQIAGVDGQTVKMSDIIDIFDDANCPCLKGKPKLFFIQACRSNYDRTGNAWDEGVDINEQKASPAQPQRKDTPDAKGLKDSGKQYSPDPTESEYDTSDAEPDSDYEDPDYELKAEKSSTLENKSEIDETDEKEETREQVCAGGDRIDARGTKAPPVKQEPEGDQNTSTSNAELAEIEKLQEEKVPEQHVKDSGHVLDARDPNAQQTKKEVPVIDIVHAPCLNDMLVMYASPPDKYAISGDSGGWLTSELYFTMKDLDFKPKDMDFLSFLLEVSKHVVDKMDFRPGKDAREDMKKKTGSKTVPCITHRLRHDIYFNTKLRDKSIISKIFGGSG